MLTNDTRATQGLVGLVLLTLAIASVSGVLYVAGQERVKQGAAPDATVEQSCIEAESTSQLEIKPLVGDDISREDTKVRLTFKDRDAPQAVITDLQQGKPGPPPSQSRRPRRLKPTASPTLSRRP